MVNVAEASHEGIAETAEVSAVLHSLGEDITYVVFAYNVNNVDDVVLNPFTDCILLQFHVAESIEGLAIGSEDA